MTILSPEHFRTVFPAEPPAVGTEAHLAQELRPHRAPFSGREHSPGAVQLTDVVLPVGVGRNVLSPDVHLVGIRVEFEVFG